MAAKESPQTSQEKENHRIRRYLHRQEIAKQVGDTLASGTFIGVGLLGLFGCGLVMNLPYARLLSREDLASTAFFLETVGVAIVSGIALNTLGKLGRKLYQKVKRDLITISK